LREDETKPPGRYSAHALVKAMKEAGIGRPSTYAKTVDRLQERNYIAMEEGSLMPTESGRNIWLEAAPLFCLSDQREVFQTEYTAAMEALLDDVAEGRRAAGETWETMLKEFKSAHAAAQAASKSGPLTPRTRQMLQDYLDAAPELAGEIADLDMLSEHDGRALLDEFRKRGITLPPSKKQKDYLDRLLEISGLTLPEALESAEILLKGKVLSRDEASALIDHLKTRNAEHRVPSAKQLSWIAELAKKAGLTEAAACALVGLSSYDELSGGTGGTASALIDVLRGASEGQRPEEG